MKLFSQKQAQCQAYALAMALDIEPEIVLKMIGHDGLKLHKGSLQGHHLDELQSAALNFGYAPVFMSINPYLRLRNGIELPVRTNILERIVKHDRTVLIGETHAWATDGELVYDPNGKTFPLICDWIRDQVCYALLVYQIKS